MNVTKVQQIRSWLSRGLKGCLFVVLAQVVALAADEHAHNHSTPSQQAEKTEKAEITGDPYTLAECVVSGQKLGAMGEPVIHNYKGREIRFCSKEHIKVFEKEPEKYIEKIDAAMIKDQLPFYPLETCVVTGNKLDGSMGEPVNVIDHNRLLRFCCNMCVAEFEKKREEFLSKLDAAVVAKQKDHYSLKRCVVSGDALGGSMGAIVDVVVANRLVRLCCPDCKTALSQDPLQFLSKIDQAATSSEGKNTFQPKPHKRGGHTN